MKELHYTYRMTLTFNAPVEAHFFTLRCQPASTPVQQALSGAVITVPEVVLREGEDGWGNYCLIGQLMSPHDSLSLAAEGCVALHSEAHEGCAPVQAAPYAAFTPFTRPGEALTLLARRFLLRRGMSDRAKAEMFMRGVHNAIDYAPRSTTVRTTAEQAAARHQGVCQDMTQILLSLCRMEGIPCRYCAGLLEGEGATHAWAEVYAEGMWLGLDPTNAIPVAEQHIKLTQGRDHADCPLECGVFRGTAMQQMEIHAAVQPLHQGGNA